MGDAAPLPGQIRKQAVRGVGLSAGSHKLFDGVLEMRHILSVGVTHSVTGLLEQSQQSPIPRCLPQ
jgi:hypothetical protein